MRGGHMGRGGRGGPMRRTRGGVPPGLGPMGPIGAPASQGNPRGGNGGKVPFDLTFFEDIFPRVAPALDDTQLTAALLKRNTDITPSTEEIQMIQNLVTRVQGIMENLILTPGTFDSCQIDEVRTVGSFKQGVILAGHKTADFVVILKTLPTPESVEALSNKILDELRQNECVQVVVTKRGFDITNLQACIRILVTTIPQNMRKLDPEIHLDGKLMNEHWQAIRHSRWFEENVHNSTVKVLMRLLRDMRQRFPNLEPLAPWMLDLLAHYAIMNNPARQALPINLAFRRTLSLMAAGMYLPGYVGTSMRGHALTMEQQDMVTTGGQILVRVLSAGGYKVILGLEQHNVADIINEPSVWDGVVISPLEKINFKVDEIEKIDGEDEEEESNSMETETET